MRRKGVLLAAIAVLAAVGGIMILSSPTAADGPPAVSGTVASCDACHSQDINFALPSGEKLRLRINPDTFAATVHGTLLCTDCHSTIQGYPHPENTANTAREYAISQQTLCVGCHKAVYDETSQSIHKATGNSLLCIDCHDVHEAAPRTVANQQVSATCNKCHTDIGQTYRNSVHGASLTEGNSDLPDCTTCHSAHKFEVQPSRLQSVDQCSSCHGDVQLMNKHGISTNVVNSYLSDYHGKTAALLGKQTGSAAVAEAVCTDCHGVHDIQKMDTATLATLNTNLVNTCRKCHTDASENFASAWLAHSEPSPQKAPVVFAVEWFYRLMIPFVVVGLLIHVSLDVRHSIKRKKGG